MYDRSYICMIDPSHRGFGVLHLKSPQYHLYFTIFLLQLASQRNEETPS